MKFSISLLFLALVSVPWSKAKGSCGHRPASVRVVNGQDAKANSWPWMVQIEHSEDGHVCGGSLISPTWVLTAAHCMQDSMDVYTFTLGEHDRRIIEGQEQPFKAKRVIIHQNYSKPSYLNNDVALVELEKPVQLHSKVNLVCLPEDGVSKPVGSTCHTAGWGLTKGGGKRAPILQDGIMPPISNTKCQKQFNSLIKITSKMICAGNGANRVINCITDSGGPLMCPNPDGTWVLEGVVSFGNPSCPPGQFTVYGRVSQHIKWIQKHTGI